MPKHNFTVRLNDDMHNWLKKEAQAQQRSVGNLIEYVLHMYRQNQNGISPDFPYFSAR